MKWLYFFSSIVGYIFKWQLLKCADIAFSERYDAHNGARTTQEEQKQNHER
jgi:hypothetical protein